MNKVKRGKNASKENAKSKHKKNRKENSNKGKIEHIINFVEKDGELSIIKKEKKRKEKFLIL